MEVPLEASSAKLRELRDQPYPLTETGLAIQFDENKNTLTTFESGSSTQNNQNDASSSSDSKKKKTTKKMPGMRMCHLCGTPQLLNSFAMHYGRCAQAWSTDESLKPVSMQRPLPAGPRLTDGTEPTAATPAAQLEDFNREALAIWKSQSLETCPNCRRSFHAKALRAHVRGCHGSDFLGASFMGSGRKESSRSYPTVEESLLRSPRVPVSKAGKLKLDSKKIDQRRSVPPRRSPASSKKKAKGPSSASSLDEGPAERRRPARRRHKAVVSETKDKTLEDRIARLETGHDDLAAALQRIEALLRNSHVVTPPATPQRGEKILAQEHRRIFRGNIDLAWPEEPPAVIPDEAPSTLPRHDRRGDGRRGGSPRVARPRSPRGFIWRPEPLT